MNPHAIGCRLLGEHQCSCGWSQQDYQRELAIASGQKGAAEKIAAWLDGLSRRADCPPEKIYWYRGVALDIRDGRAWNHAFHAVAQMPTAGEAPVRSVTRMCAATCELDLVGTHRCVHSALEGSEFCETHKEFKR